MHSDSDRNRALCVDAIEMLRSSIPTADLAQCRHFIDHDEWGLALMTLTHMPNRSLEVDKGALSRHVRTQKARQRTVAAQRGR